jgi:SnoaL-like domain
MTDLSDTVDTYLSGWNEIDPQHRASIIQSVWASDGRLIDPPFAATGRDEITNMVAALQSQFPDHHFVRTSGIDEHHNHFRFAWDLVAADDSTALSGIDVGELSDDGTISRITGFFGDIPATDEV